MYFAMLGNIPDIKSGVWQCDMWNGCRIYIVNLSNRPTGVTMNLKTTVMMGLVMMLMMLNIVVVMMMIMMMLLMLMMMMMIMM